jgi:hypothetical protein
MTATARRGAWAAASAVFLVLALTSACDSGGDDGPAPSTRTLATDSPDPTTAGTSPPVSRSPMPTGTTPEDPAEAEKEIREAWRILFAPESSVDERSDVIEDGYENALMTENLFADPLGSRLRAEVTSVSYISSLSADVRYALTREGRRLDTGGPGAAVFQDDTWKVALQTVCDLTWHAKDAPQAPRCE